MPSESPVTEPTWVAALEDRRELNKALRHVDARRDLEPAEEVTQLGNTAGFRELPRFDKPEWEISVVLGRCDPDTASRAAFKRPAKKSSRVRFFECATLRSSDYRPRHTPHAGSTSHASIFGWVDEKQDAAGARAWWEDPRRVTLAVLAVE